MSSFACVRTAETALELITLAQAKEHLRIIGTAEDDIIGRMLAAAIEDAQRCCGLQFCDAQYTLYLDDFPCDPGEIRFPVWPVLSVTSVSYRNSSNEAATVSSGDYQVGARTARMVPVDTWPDTYGSLENVVIVFRAGWSTAAAVPRDIVAAVLLILGDRYENRGDGGSEAGRTQGALAIPLAARRILDGHRRMRFDEPV